MKTNIEVVFSLEGLDLPSKQAYRDTTHNPKLDERAKSFIADLINACKEIEPIEWRQLPPKKPESEYVEAITRYSLQLHRMVAASIRDIIDRQSPCTNKYLTGNVNDDRPPTGSCGRSEVVIRHENEFVACIPIGQDMHKVNGVIYRSCPYETLEKMVWVTHNDAGDKAILFIVKVEYIFKSPWRK